MRGERGFRPKGIVGQKIGLNGGAQFQKMKSHRKKGILRRAHASRRAPVEGNESILRGDKKAYDRTDAPRQFEKGIEDAIDDVVSGLRNKAEMGQFFALLGTQFEVFIEKWEDQSCEKQGSIQRLREIFPHLGINFPEDG